MIGIILALALVIVYNLGKDSIHENLKAIGGVLTFWGSEADVDFHLCEIGIWEYCWPRWMPRAAYTAKAIVCILLGRAQWGGWSKSVEVGAYDIRPCQGEYSGDDWTSVHVGRGWGQWWYYTDRDSSV